jgi:rhodanese-related sulfurtransferase
MSEPTRISPEAVRSMVDAGEAILVCAYEDDEKFRRVQLAGAIPLSEFQARLPALEKSREIVFYCA